MGKMTRGQIKKLLARKKLKGRDAARLILMDAAEVDLRQEKGLLTDSEASAIRNAVPDGPETVEFNKWIRALRSVYVTIKEAQVLQLQATVLIFAMSKDLWLAEATHGHHHILQSLPAVMTEKEFKERAAKQKKQDLSEFAPIGFVLSAAWETDTGYQAETGFRLGAVMSSIEEDDPDLAEGADIVRVKAKELRGLIEKGALAVRPGHKEKTLDLLTQIETDFSNYEICLLLGANDPLILDHVSLSEAAGIEREVAQPRPGLEEAVIPVKSLYSVGFPPWPEYVDKYNHRREPEIRHRTYMESVAILQDPEPHDLDNRGYFCPDKVSSHFTDYGAYYLTAPGTRYADLKESQKARAKWKGPDIDLVPGEREKTKSLLEEGPPSERFKTRAEEIGSMVRSFLGAKAIVDGFSELIGVDFSRELEIWRAELKRDIGMHNAKVRHILDWAESLNNRDAGYMGMAPAAPAVALQLKEDFSGAKIPELEDLAPDPETEEYIKARIGQSLGDEWFKEVWEKVDNDRKRKEAKG